MTLPSKTRRERRRMLMQRRERRRMLMRTKLVTARLLGIPGLETFSRNAPRECDLTDLQALINAYTPKKQP